MKPLILWGGTDIDPQIYFEEPLPTTDKPDVDRDSRETVAVVEAIDSGRPIIGICRGAQLLCALNGGKLDQHNPSHRNNSHPIFTSDGELLLNVAADHHQTMKPAGNFIIYGVSPSDNVPEVVYWPATRCLAVQPHPEWMHREHSFNKWLDNLIFNLFGEKGIFNYDELYSRN